MKPNLDANHSDVESINKAIQSFADWSRPWDFLAVVQTAPGLSERGRSLLGEVWESTLDSGNWTSPDLAECAKKAEECVKHKYPWLNERSAQALANAAAYQWK